jgi:hypothetical protein
MKEKKQNLNIEEDLLNNAVGFDYEAEMKKRIEKEIREARELKEKKERFLIETDISKIANDEKFDKNSIYKVFNRKQKTETFVNGEQAKNLIKYTDEYVLMFDHRIIEA